MKVFEVPLWSGGVPFDHAVEGADVPSLVAYLPDVDVNTRFGMLAFAGGAYRFRSEWSGREYGEWFAARGVAVFVVNFRLGSDGFDYRAKCADAYRALALVREQGPQWGVAPDRVGVIGTSAGGHLGGVMCSSAGRHFLTEEGIADSEQIPDFGVFCYGVMSLTDPLAHSETRKHFLGDRVEDPSLQQAFSPLLNATPTHPRSFIWHTAEDTEVDASNSLEYARALAGQGVPYELHIYEKGDHALGLARSEGLCWAEDCLRWIVGRT